METTAKSNLPSKNGDAASKSETKPPDGGATAQPSSSEPPTATSDAPAAAGGSASGTDTSPANEKTETAVAAPEGAATKTTDPAREVFIAVMGGTGTGKSTFINQVTGMSLKAGHGLASCTQNIQIASTTINGQKVTLIDTPGFDEYGRGDAEILTLISIWLKRWHTQDKLLSGVIYLHRITDPRMTGGSVRALILLQKMCGTKTYHNIALATTMWDTVVADAGEQRQKELKERYWDHILSGGGSIYRHDDKETSAKKIVMDLLPHESASLDIQDQMQVNPIISSTVAGGYAKEEMEKLLKLETEEIVKLKASIEQGKASENALRAELARSMKIIEKMKEDMDRLNMKVMELETAPNTGTITETQQTFVEKIRGMLGVW